MKEQTFNNRVQYAWRMTPAIVEVREISEASEIPDEKDCDINQLYLGIIRGKKTDCAILVKHSQTFFFRLSARAEDLTDAVLSDCGIIPNRVSMICRVCHQFSTFINTDGMCYDCFHKRNV